MKKRHISIIISLVMIFTGIVMIITGFTLGASFTAFSYSDTESFSNTFTEDIKNVKIDFGAGKLIIKKSDSFRIEADEVSEGSVKYKVQDDTLVIDSERNKWAFFNVNGKATLTVYIPKTLDELEISMGAGKMTLDDIEAEYADIETGAGFSGIKNLTAGHIEIDCGAGEVRVEDSDLADINISAGVGKVSVSGEISGDCIIDGGVGEIQINSTSSINDYSFDVSKGIGDVSINGRKPSYYEENNGKYKMIIDQGVGEIEINMN